MVLTQKSGNHSWIKELSSDMRDEQKKRALDGWDRMNVKRQLEDSLRDAQGEIADLKARVESLEFLVEKLTRPVPEIPQEAVFRPASPPLPDIGFPPDMEIPGVAHGKVDKIRIGRMIRD